MGRGLEFFIAVGACKSSSFAYVIPMNSLILPSSDHWNLSGHESCFIWTEEVSFVYQGKSLSEFYTSEVPHEHHWKKKMQDVCRSWFLLGAEEEVPFFSSFLSPRGYLAFVCWLKAPSTFKAFQAHLSLSCFHLQVPLALLWDHLESKI